MHLKIIFKIEIKENFKQKKKKMEKFILFAILIQSLLSLPINKEFDGILTHDKLIEWGFSPTDSIVINIANRDIQSIEDETFKEFTILEQLYLSSNELTSINSKMFEGLQKLKILDLRRNMIESANWDTFKNLVNLVELLISFNKIESIQDKTFEGLENLQKLDLENNEIEEIKSEKLYQNLIFIK